jgi:hypothetical protein
LANKQISKRIPYVHTAIGPFINAIKDYFTEWVYDDFQFAMVGSMDKAIQLIHQNKDDPDMLLQGPHYPMIVLTPTITEQVKTMDLPHKYTTYHPYQSKWFQRPFVFQNGSALDIVSRRMTGTVEFKIFAESLMEIHDIQMGIIDAFRGLNKWMPIQHIKQFLVLEADIRLLTDEGLVFLDWSETDMSEDLIRSINANKYYMPVGTTPWVNLQNLSDASSFYGGTGFPEYALVGSLDFELELPVLYNIYTDLDITSIETQIGVSFTPNYEDEMNKQQSVGETYLGMSYTDRGAVPITISTDDYDIPIIIRVLRKTVFEIEAPYTCPLVLTNENMNALYEHLIVSFNGDLIQNYESINEHTIQINCDEPTTDTAIIEVVEYKEPKC